MTDDEGCLEGPFNAFLLQPALGDRLQALGGSIRYETGLSGRAREIAILIVAAHWDSAFERYAHEAVGRAVGLTDDEMAAIRSGDDAIWGDPLERTVATASRALVAEGDLDDEQYAAAAEALGEAGVFELVVLVGYYVLLAMQLRVFRVALPAAVEDLPGSDSPDPTSP